MPRIFGSETSAAMLARRLAAGPLGVPELVETAYAAEMLDSTALPMF